MEALSNYPVMLHQCDERPYSFVPGPDEPSVRRQDSLQEREHAGEIYTNAYVVSVYPSSLHPQREAQRTHVASPLRHEVREHMSKTAHEQQPRSPVAFPKPLRVEKVQQTPGEGLRIPMTEPRSELQQQLPILEVTPTLIKTRPISDTIRLLPHSKSTDPLQRLQHNADGAFLDIFAANAYRDPLPGPLRPQGAQYGYQIARKPLPVSAKVMPGLVAHSVPSPHLAPVQQPRDRLRDRFRVTLRGKLQRAKEIYDNGPSGW
ncbi:hypothetical protein BDW02DRAFT_578113 [Decorospora gaudefroyi]|uniref:Uncharacterized protein n=1 Tax=Decorospora gaudefroyi TaxID=184978 RepID=A0A6A5KKF2_9PLEO|nr:hypothetical protein BDW02DRAFT_578113 [Decorospora gaudefroyi]